MPNFYFSATSLKNLEGVHPDLVQLMKTSLATSSLDFGITCGLRSKEKQKEYFDRDDGTTKTMNSRHLTGHAVDLLVYRGCKYEDGKTQESVGYYQKLYDHIQKIADEIRVDITWGGHWKTIHDYGHYELSWKAYPLK